MNKETRGQNGHVEIRELKDGKKVITGYAIVFDSESRNLGGFTETIDPDAMKDADVSDVVALLNHDTNLVLGRTDKTLTIVTDKKGLRYEIRPPDTQAGRDVVTSIERGDIRGSSFGFTVKEDEWTEPKEKGGNWERKITKFDRIYDVSPVVYPAYEATDTGVAKRDLGVKKDEKERVETDKLEQEKAKREAEMDNYYKEKELELTNIKED